MTGIPPHDLPRILAARQRPRTAVERILDHACDGPRRIEHAIGSLIGSALLLLWLGWRLGKR